MRSGNLDKRLMSLADLVRQGAVFADIGTDHAYLPVFLLQSDKISKAILTDINEGPLNSAKHNVALCGLSDKCELLLTDGAKGTEKYGITDYAICGMGGELIARIINDAPFMKNKGIRLILQPMTRQGFLRKYLLENGFEILDEVYSYCDGKYYLGILAEYSGNACDISKAELELGNEKYALKGNESYIGYMTQKKRSYEKIIAGKLKANGDCEDIKELLLAVQTRIDAAELNTSLK